jgi:hypothetical protein
LALLCDAFLLSTAFFVLPVLAILLANFTTDAAAQDKKKRTGNLVGEVKSKMNFKKGNNVYVEILAPGEEKARRYHIIYDPKIKGPNETVRKVVLAAEVGDQVRIEWVDTGEGLAITAMEVLKKGAKDKK